MQGRLPAFVRLPPAGHGQRIGLLGGSFNPPHMGHRHISIEALRRLQLDWIWWLVTPGNPLKCHDNLAPLDERMAAARACADHPRVRITDVERHLGSAFTAETIASLRARRPDLRFVWLMGADNLSGFHRWNAWRDIARRVPIAVLDRPGRHLAALRAPAAQALAPYRLRENNAGRLGMRRPPALVFLHTPLIDISSTGLRRKLARSGQSL